MWLTIFYFQPKKTELTGLTGPVLLDGDGLRSDFSLDVLDRYEDFNSSSPDAGSCFGACRMVKSGRWSLGEGGLNYSRQHPSDREEVDGLEHARALLRTKTIRVATLTVKKEISHSNLNSEMKNVLYVLEMVLVVLSFCRRSRS